MRFRGLFCVRNTGEPMKRFQHSLEIVEQAIEWVGIVVLVAMLVISVAEIVARDTFNAPISGSLDMTLLIMIWMVLLVSGIGLRSDLHIRVGFFVEKLPEIVKRIILIIVYAAILFFGIEMTIQSFPLIALPGVMPELGISNAWTFAPLLFSGILTVVSAVERILRIAIELKETKHSEN
jgi:TRAP-type C4-dicarboxylate transport system permease small subunit